MEIVAVAEIYMAKKVLLDLYECIAVYLNAFTSAFTPYLPMMSY